MKKSLGFTLIELLITMAIVVILTTMATPSFDRLLNRAHSDTAIKELTELLATARQSALLNGVTVIICPTKNYLVCESTRNWGDTPLIAFIDKDVNRSLDESDIVIASTPALAKGSTLEFRSSLGLKYLRWTPEGTTYFQGSNFTYCPPNRDDKLARHIIMSMAGRIYFGKDSNDNGIVENRYGEDVDCSAYE